MTSGPIACDDWVNSANRPTTVTVVGAGTRFLSGMSYYTIRLANAFASRHRVGVITMRRLLPARLYPGRNVQDTALNLVKLALQLFEIGGRVAVRAMVAKMYIRKRLHTIVPLPASAGH